MEHDYFLAEALALAKERRGFCSPNPSVGAVVVKDGCIIAKGNHQGPGFEHAEVVACQNLSPKQLEGARLYVTLEPCCHWGRTPPCTQMILDKGIQEVYYAYQDPNPNVFGQGGALLRQSGIVCEHIPLPEVDRFYESYSYWTKTKKPWVTAKLALTLDSKIADEFSNPVKLTGAQADQFTHQRRLNADAILTTATTIIQDDPRLDARFDGKTISKHLFIVDSKLSLPLEAKVFATAQRITVFFTQGDRRKIEAITAKNADCHQIKKHDGLMDLVAVIQKIGEQGIHDLWVEVGSKLFCALLHQKLVNSCYLYIAPKLLGERAKSAFANDTHLFSHAKSTTWFQLGEDVVCEIQF